MPTLAELQSDFAAALREPDAAVPEPVARAHGGRAKRRFDVYRNNRASSLIEALSATFPAVRKLTGAAFFEAAAKLHVDRSPPRSPLLFEYGDGFGDFLDGFPPAASVPYLGDVARLEWARLAAFHAEDAAPLAIGCLQGIPPDRLADVALRLHPSLSLLRSRWPVASLWAASMGDGAAGEVEMSRPEDVAVLRPLLEVEMRVLPPGGYDFIEALRRGRTLGDAALACAEGIDGFDLAHHLDGLFRLGAVVAIEPGP